MRFLGFANHVFLAKEKVNEGCEGSSVIYLAIDDQILAGYALDKETIDFLIEQLKECRDIVPDLYEDANCARNAVFGHYRLMKKKKLNNKKQA